jgi:hypothetical protein
VRNALVPKQVRAVVGAILLLVSPNAHAGAQIVDHSHHASHLGAGVMPFDLARSLHIFKPAEDGGSMKVLSRDGDADQIAAIRRHLRREAKAFAKGDYSDPAAIHGAAMPGLSAMEAGAGRIDVEYVSTLRGAELCFSTRDPRLIETIHEWLKAQAHDHGGDSMTRP